MVKSFEKCFLDLFHAIPIPLPRAVAYLADGQHDWNFHKHANNTSQSRAFFADELPIGERLAKALSKQASSAPARSFIACIVLPKRLEEEIVAADSIDGAIIEKYQAWLKSEVAPLHFSIRCWEILNEPNLWRIKADPKKGFPSMPPEKYVPLLMAAFKTIKEIDPGICVVGVCLNGGDFEYLKKTMDLGAGSFMDACSIHPYRSPPIYPDLMRFHGILDGAAFKGPLINTEQYFGANTFMQHGSDEETSRTYYVPGKDELEACSRTVRNYIQHAAAGVPYCAFAPTSTQFRFGGCDQWFLNYLFGATNAASRLLSNAGECKPVQMGGALKAFLFMDAPDGPLLACYSLAPEACGGLSIAEPCEGFDMMGNKIESSGRSFSPSDLAALPALPEGAFRSGSPRRSFQGRHQRAWRAILTQASPQRRLDARSCRKQSPQQGCRWKGARLAVASRMAFELPGGSFP